MAEIKELYELSVWRDIFEQREGVDAAKWHEDKVAVFGGNGKTDASRAFNVKLSIDIYGQETLTFDLCSKYYDEDGTQIDNPYLGLIYNEAKVKMKFREQWHDFIVKSAQEKHTDGLVLSFECQALAIYELSKSGYDITFSEGIGNNVLTAGEFMVETLEGSGWEFERGSADLLEESLEQACMVQYGVEGGAAKGKLYEVRYEMDSDGNYQRSESTDPITITDGSIFLIPYSENNRKGQEGIYIEDGSNIEYDSWSGKVGNGIRCYSYEPLVGDVCQYRVNKVKEAAKYVYNEKLDRYVTVYKKDSAQNYYGYESYTYQPYLLLTKRTEDSLIATVMNTPSIAAGYTYYLDSARVSSEHTHESSFSFSGLKASTSYTLKVELFDSNGYAIDTSGNRMYNADGTRIDGTGPAAVYSIKGTTTASGSEWNIDADDFAGLESSEAANFTTVYFKEGDEDNLTTSLPSGYAQVKSYEKSRTMEIEKSNRFNITQQIAEQFEVWCKYIIDHDETGHITRKYVMFSDDYGQENKVGFRYGVNLSEITRDVKSDELVTKLYVSEIETSTEESGYCSIADADENPSGEEFLFDFSYFITKGLLTWEQVKEDLYGEAGYYTVMKQLNKEYNEIVSKQLGYGDDNLQNQKLKLQTSLETADAKIYAAQDSISAYESRLDGLEGDALKEVQDYIDEYKQVIVDARAEKVEIQKKLKSVEALLEKYQNQLDKIKENRKKKDAEFYTKYSRFIQEGTWDGEDYIEPNSYYYDAQKILSRSARPQISYQLSVVDVSSLIDPETEWSYSPYAFKVGDLSTIVDTQYFGYESDGVPKKEKVVVSKVEYYPDSPEKNSIEIQNYTTEFQDLFSSLTAAVQSLQFNKNTYAKADNFNSSGALIFDSLQESFDKNKALAQKNAGSTYSLENGIITVKSEDGQDIVKITNGAIVLSNDGGETWKTGIYGGRINTALLMAGEIDTSQINLKVGKSNAFVWDKDGITAYKTTSSVDSSGKVITTYQKGYYTRFNQNGIEGVIKNSNGDDAVYTGSFKLGWDGLRLNIKAEDESAAKTEVINSNDNFIVRADGSIVAKNGTFKGHVEASSGTFTGTLEGATLIGGELMIGGPVKGASGYGVGSNYKFHVDSDGNATLNGNINMSNGAITWSNLSNEVITNINNKITRALYAREAVGEDNTPALDYSDYTDDDRKAWHKIYDADNDAYVSYSYDGGAADTWTYPEKIVPQYITRTYIDSTEIKSPTISGNEIYAIGYFAIGESKNKMLGYLGPAEGSGTIPDGSGGNQEITTHGVAISAATGVSTSGTYITPDTTTPYLIATSAGVRMSAGGAGIYVSDKGAFYKQSSSDDWAEIGSGGSGGVAVFG